VEPQAWLRESARRPDHALAAVRSSRHRRKAASASSRPASGRIPSGARSDAAPAQDVRAGKVKSAQGSELTLTTAGGVKVDGANVVKTDIVADNGVIHVIDSVVLPRQ
jgi:hypothetical protein